MSDQTNNEKKDNVSITYLNDLIDFIGSDIHNIHQVNCFNKKIKIKEVNKLEKIIDNNKLFNKS